MISVGEPKELYIRVYPTGKKVFYLRASKFKEFITLGQAQKGILNVTGARELAKEKLKAKNLKKVLSLNTEELFVLEDILMLWV